MAEEGTRPTGTRVTCALPATPPAHIVGRTNPENAVHSTSPAAGEQILRNGDLEASPLLEFCLAEIGLIRRIAPARAGWGIFALVVCGKPLILGGPGRRRRG